MDAARQRRLVTAAQILTAAGRAAAALMFVALIAGFAFPGILLLGLVATCGVAVFALALATRCATCGRRATFLGPRNKSHPYPLSAAQRWLSLVWPTRASLAVCQCRFCGGPYKHGPEA